MVTEERDKLRNLLNEFKRMKNDEAGDEVASGTLVQVLIFLLMYLFSLLFFIFLFTRSLIMIFVRDLCFQELESSLAKKEFCIKEMESSLHVQKEVNTRQYEEIKLLNEKLNSEARKIKSLEREGDRLRSEIALLESKVGAKDILSIADIVVIHQFLCS